MNYIDKLWEKYSVENMFNSDVKYMTDLSFAEAIEEALKLQRQAIYQAWFNNPNENVGKIILTAKIEDVE
jgi:predicted DNA-binding protein YlxM (UPF0122 family)